jgi:hypothetical protein
MSAAGFQAVLGDGRGAGARRRKEQQVAAKAARAVSRAERATRRREQATVAARVRQAPLARFAYFRPRRGPQFFWTTQPNKGYYLSGILADDGCGVVEVRSGTVEAHKLRREAKARALALCGGWLFAHGRAR